MANNNMPLTTKEKIYISAVALFSEHWYDTVSVAEICRNSGLSNGVFYRYYKDKESLFREILDKFLEVIEGRMKKVSGSDVETRLVSFYELILESNINDQAYISIFREGEFMFPEYDKRLREIYIDSLKKVYEKTVSIAEYLYIVGGVRFLLKRPCFEAENISAEYLKDLAFNGLLHCQESIDYSCLDIELPPAVDYSDEDDTRTKLILSGKQLIAEKSFYNVNIYEITRKAGFSVGTFYLNFKSKEDFFRSVVDFLGKDVRHYISSKLSENLSRIESEIQGWILFLKYFENNVKNYQILRQAEFVIKDSAREYYNRFESGYLKNTDGIRIDNHTVAVNYLIGIVHYLGIEYFYSKNIDTPQQVVKELSVLLCCGVKGV